MNNNFYKQGIKELQAEQLERKLKKSEDIGNLAAGIIIANKGLTFHGEERVNRVTELINDNKELEIQSEEIEDWEAELVIANKELAYQSEEKAERAAELVIANKELAYQSEEKADRAAELVIANKELAYQSGEKADRAAELVIANKELAYQSGEKADRAAELMIANKELAYQSGEKADRAAELMIANKELAYQIGEKADRAAELIIANKELTFQNQEKGKRAAELIIANKELTFQNQEKGKRAAELIIANKELTFQNQEKEKRAAELIIANKELAFQNEEKGKRAAELIIANKELTFQNQEKGKRAAELIIANKELTFLYEEKGKRSAELIIANKELTFQNAEKSKRAAELIIANKTQGEFFVNMSHELKTPLNVIFSTVQLFDMYCKSDSLEERKNLIIKYIDSIKQNCYRLSKLINNIVDLSKIEAGFFKLNLSNKNIVEVVEEIVMSVTDFTEIKGLSIIFDTDIEEKVIACDPEKIERIVLNLISNAIKFSDDGDEIFVDIKDKNEFVEISVKDNGIGIEEKNLNLIFDRFEQVDKSLSKNVEGTGIGLSLVKSIVELHGGTIQVESLFGKGSKFTVILPSWKVFHENMIYSSKVSSVNETIQVELSDIYL